MSGVTAISGNLTSQWFANYYLDEADHYITDGLSAAGYIRYMDDMKIYPGLLRFQGRRLRRSFRLAKNRQAEYIEGKIDEVSMVDSIRAICAKSRYFGIKPDFGRQVRLRK